MTTSLELLATTALISTLSAVVALLLGYPIGLWLSNLGKSKRLVTAFLLLPFLLPAFLIGLSLRPIFESVITDSRIGILLIVAAHAFMNAGFIAIVTSSSLIPREQIEAAELDGASKFKIRTQISLPQQLPALSAAALLVALYSATSYGLIISLGQGQIQTLETEIAKSAMQDLDITRAAVLAGLQTLLTISFFVFANRLGANPTSLFGQEGESPQGSRLGTVLGFCLLIAVLFVVLGVFQRAVTEGPGLFGNMANLAGRGTRDILNISVLEAAGNSLRNLVVATLISLTVAWLISRNRLGVLVLLPIGISPVVIGLIALVISGYLPVPVSSSWLLLPVVQSVFLIPLAFQVIAPARRAVSTEMLEAAMLDGASGVKLFGLIELPTLARPLAAAAALVSLGSLGEFGAASFLAFGSEATLPLVMFRLMSRPGGENLGMAMTAASFLILLALVVVAVISSNRTSRRVQSDASE